MDRSIPAALQHPTTTSPPRVTPSARRTSSIDIIPGRPGTDQLVLAGQVRDLVTSAEGTPRVAGEARIRAELGPGRRLLALDAAPWLPPLADLVGLPVAAGFRAAVDRVVGAEQLARSPLSLLPNDLPVAALIAGYGDLYVRNDEQGDDDAGPPVGPATPGTPAPHGTTGPSPDRRMVQRSDICSGWRSGGTMFRLNEELGHLPVPVGPAAPALERSGDPFSWHETGPTSPGWMRRRRLIDVTPGDPLTVFAMFRDTYTDRHGHETVLHEYTVDLRVDPATLEVVEGAATPRNLPWPECPTAAGSAARMAGHRVDELSELVRTDFRGITTCTHLNDLVRSLTCVGALAAAL
jgi:hypothetical protein